MSKGWGQEAKRTYWYVKERLKTDFPFLFNPERPLPLAIGMDSQLARYYATQPCNYTHKEFKIFLRFWTSRIEYQYALATQPWRYGISASAFKYYMASSVRSTHKLHALNVLQQHANKPKFRELTHIHQLLST